MKKTIILSSALVISALIISLPYKESKAIMLGVTIHWAIYKDIAALFTLGLWTHIAVLFVLLPPLLLIEVGQTPLRWYKKLLFLFEGIFAFLAALLIYFMMSFELFEAGVILTPIFYLSLAWVIFGGIAAIVLMKKKLYEKAAHFLKG